jgi:hypothetical protein
MDAGNNRTISGYAGWRVFGEMTVVELVDNTGLFRGKAASLGAGMALRVVGQRQR